MSQDSSFLKNTLDLLETDPEIKSYIYQQILEFNPFVTPETLIMVIARNPIGTEELVPHDVDPDDSAEFDEDAQTDEEYSDEEVAELKNLKYRIAIVLKEGEHSLEAEAFSDDIFEAISMAKEKMMGQLVEIQDEIESPQERMKAIQEAYENKQTH